MRGWQSKANELPHPELTQLILDESGYTAMLQADRSADAAGRLENLSELVRAMEDYESLEAFLEHVSLVMDRDNDDQRSEEHTSELQSLMRISYAVFCLKKKTHNTRTNQ